MLIPSFPVARFFGENNPAFEPVDMVPDILYICKHIIDVHTFANQLRCFRGKYQTAARCLSLKAQIHSAFPNQVSSIHIPFTFQESKLHNPNTQCMVYLPTFVHLFHLQTDLIIPQMLNVGNTFTYLWSHKYCHKMHVGKLIYHLSNGMVWVLNSTRWGGLPSSIDDSK